VGEQLFTSNTGSGNVSSFTSDAHGQLTLLGQTATDPGTVDSSATPDGRFLYVQAGGNGTVDEFSVTAGTLTEVGSVAVPGAVGGEGIAAVRGGPDDAGRVPAMRRHRPAGCAESRGWLVVPVNRSLRVSQT